MAKPTELPAWATTLSNRVKPIAGALVTGFIYSERPPPKWVNWVLGMLCDWVTHFTEHRFLSFSGSGILGSTAGTPFSLTDISGTRGVLGNDGNDYITLEAGTYEIRIDFTGHISSASTLGWDLWAGLLPPGGPPPGSSQASKTLNAAANIGVGFSYLARVTFATSTKLYLRAVSSVAASLTVTGQIYIREV